MILRVAHIADSHFSESHRLQDAVDVHRAFLEQASAAKVDLIVHAGDLFDRKSSPAERLAVADFLLYARSVAPVVVVKGNHDADLDLEVFGRMLRDDRVDIMERPGAVDVFITQEPRLAVFALPWFSKAHLAASLPASADCRDSTAATIGAARGLLNTIRAGATNAAKAGLVPILVAHVQVGGSVTSTGQVMIGQSVEFSPQDLLDTGCAYVALGHVHKHQSWCDGRVCYAGSPLRQNFGEPEAKGWVLVTLDTDAPGWFVGAEFRELPARRIELVECHTDADLRELQHRDFTGALVRLRYYTTPALLANIDEDALAHTLLAGGAAEVKIEAVLVHEVRQRAPEIVTAKTTADKVVSYWDAKGVLEDDTHGRARVLDRLSEIESAQREEVPSCA